MAARIKTATGTKFLIVISFLCAQFFRWHDRDLLGAPLPAQLVLDKQGKLRYKHVFSFLSNNASVETLLKAVSGL